MNDYDIAQLLRIYVAQKESGNKSMRGYLEHLAQKRDLDFEEVQHKAENALEVFRNA